MGVLLTVGVIQLAQPYPGNGQTAPDAGAIQQQRQQQLERERRERLPAQVPELSGTQPPREPAPPSPSVLVTEYEFEGNTIFSQQDLRLVLRPFTNREMDLALLREATLAVAERYRAAGKMVHVYLPQQDITDGHVRIAILEAKLGEVLYEGDPAIRVRQNLIVGIVSRQLAPGDMIDTNKLDRALLLADDLPGVQVNGSVEAGEETGRTNVRLMAKSEPLVHGDVTIDNGGPRAVGSIRGLANFRLESPFRFGDRLTVNTMATEGSQYARAAYTVPVGRDGWRVGINGSWLAYRLVAPEFEALHAKGSMYTVGLEALYPLIRARNYNLQWLMNYDHRRFDNRALGVRQSEYRIDEGTMALSGNEFDDLLGTSGATFGSLGVVLGHLGQGERQPGENPDVNGSITKLTWYLSREQTIVSWMSLYGAFMGQKAFTPMDAAERFFLGGPQNLRAYPVFEAGGSTGWLTTGEVRGHLPWGVGITGFFDAGRVENPEAAGRSYMLKGGGLMVSWSAPKGVTLSGTWAHRLGDNLNPTSTGKDQDGSLHKNRFWFAVTYAF